MLNHKGLRGTVPSPAVAVPTGNSTTRRSCSVNHGGHAGAAPRWLWKAPGQWDLPGEGAAGTQRRGQLGAGGCQPGHAERPGQLVAALLTVTTGTTVPSRGSRSTSPGEKRSTELHPAKLGCRQCGAATRKSLPRVKLLPLFLPAPVSVGTQPFPQNNGGKEHAHPGGTPPSLGAGRGCQQTEPHQQSRSIPSQCLQAVTAPLIPPPTALPALLAHPARRNSTFRGAVPSRAGLGWAGPSRSGQGGGGSSSFRKSIPPILILIRPPAWG